MGVVIYESLQKAPDLTMQQKRDLIVRGKTSLQRAEEMKPGYFEAMLYHNLLLRTEASLETDREKQKALTEEADALRERAKEVTMKRHEAVAPAPAEPPAASPQTGEAGDAAPAAPLKVGGDVKAPVVIKRVEPEYTEKAKAAHVAGIVIMQLTIDKSGRVTAAEVIKPLPFGLNQTALAAVKQWEFKPATRNGVPVDVIFLVTLNFRPKE